MLRREFSVPSDAGYEPEPTTWCSGFESANPRCTFLMGEPRGSDLLVGKWSPKTRKLSVRGMWFESTFRRWSRSRTCQFACGWPWG